jgi:hypothetical protein
VYPGKGNAGLLFVCGAVGVDITKDTYGKSPVYGLAICSLSVSVGYIPSSASDDITIEIRKLTVVPKPVPAK